MDKQLIKTIEEITLDEDLREIERLLIKTGRIFNLIEYQSKDNIANAKNMKKALENVFVVQKRLSKLKDLKQKENNVK